MMRPQETTLMPTLTTSFKPLAGEHEPEAAYFTSDAWGSSSAKQALISTRKAMDAINGLDRTESDAFDLGSAVDQTLCPCPHAKPSVIRPKEIDGRTKEGKAWLAEHAGHNVISAEHGRIIQHITDRLPSPIKTMLSMAAEAQGFQRVFRTVDMESGLAVQCRFDILRGDQPYDLKTTSSTLEDWPRSAWTYGYAFQAAWYSWVASLCGRKLAPMRYLVVETKSPWRSCIYTPDSDWLAAGEAQRVLAVERLAQAERTGDWSDHGDLDRILTLPRWALKPGSTAGDMPAFGE